MMKWKTLLLSPFLGLLFNLTAIAGNPSAANQEFHYSCIYTSTSTLKVEGAPFDVYSTQTQALARTTGSADETVQWQFYFVKGSFRIEAKNAAGYIQTSATDAPNRIRVETPFTIVECKSDLTILLKNVDLHNLKPLKQESEPTHTYGEDFDSYSEHR